MNQTISVLLAIGLYLALPAVMIWGWLRWRKSREPRSVLSTLSFIGFTLGTVSGLLAISATLYSRAVGGFPLYGPSVMRIYRWGTILSLVAVLFAIIGVWRPGPLRWHAPVCAVGTLAFWLTEITGE